MDDTIYIPRDYELDNNQEKTLMEAYISEITSIPLLSNEEEKKLFDRFIKGDKSIKEKIILSNLKLVINIAKKYKYFNIPLIDLIQEGNIGLMKAIDKFDNSTGYKFSTYATFWIKQNITRYIAGQYKNIKIPYYLFEKIKKYRKTKNELELTLNREPKNEEIAAALNITVEEIESFCKIDVDTISLNMLVGENEGKELQDIIPSANAFFEDDVYLKSIKGDINELITQCGLSEQEIYILKMRNGFSNGKCMSLQEIGDHYGISRERVRQKENSALAKIRRSNKISVFAEYTENPDESLKKLKKNI